MTTTSSSMTGWSYDNSPMKLAKNFHSHSEEWLPPKLVIQVRNKLSEGSETSRDRRVI